jgi:hypothetical protein
MVLFERQSSLLLPIFSVDLSISVVMQHRPLIRREELRNLFFFQKFTSSNSFEAFFGALSGFFVPPFEIKFSFRFLKLLFTSKTKSIYLLFLT